MKKPWVSRKRDKAVKIIIKTRILLWKTIKGNGTLKVRVRVRVKFLFYFILNSHSEAIKFLYFHLVIIIATHKEWPRLLSVCLSMWTESHKICKVWTLSNQELLRCFRSYILWLTSEIIKSLDISESIDINLSTSISQFNLIETSNFIWKFSPHIPS